MQLNSDPKLSSITLSTLHGTIEKYERLDSPMTDTQQSFAYEQYTIKLDTGKRIYYIYAPETEFDENLKNLKKPIIDRLGFLPSRLTLPKQIGVMGLFDDSGSNGIENKKVTITTHPAKNESGMQRVLWFDEK